MILINVKVFRMVMSGTVILFPYVASHCTLWHRRLEIGVILPPLVPLPVKTNIGVMNQWNVPKKRISSVPRLGLARRIPRLASLLPVSWKAFLSHLDTNNLWTLLPILTRSTARRRECLREALLSSVSHARVVRSRFVQYAHATTKEKYIKLKTEAVRAFGGGVPAMLLYQIKVSKTTTLQKT